MADYPKVWEPLNFSFVDNVHLVRSYEELCDLYSEYSVSSKEDLPQEYPCFVMIKREPDSCYKDKLWVWFLYKEDLLEALDMLGGDGGKDNVS